MTNFSEISDRITIYGFVNNQEILEFIEWSYNTSPSLRTAILDWVEVQGRTILVTFDAGQMAVPPDDDGSVASGQVWADPDAVSSALLITPNGTAASISFYEALVHELGHAISGWEDDDSFADLQGENVYNTNIWLRELGLTERASYQAVDLTGGLLIEGFEYTEGNLVENVIIDRGIYYFEASGAGHFDSGNFDFRANGVTNGALFVGAERANDVGGTDSRDYLYGAGGDDVISGHGGDDRAFGGVGSDVIYGGAGSDQLHGGMHDDFLDGGEHSDILRGGEGADTVHGGMGNDYIYAE